MAIDDHTHIPHNPEGGSCVDSSPIRPTAPTITSHTGAQCPFLLKPARRLSPPAPRHGAHVSRVPIARARHGPGTRRRAAGRCWLLLLLLLRACLVCVFDLQVCTAEHNGAKVHQYNTRRACSCYSWSYLLPATPCCSCRSSSSINPIPGRERKDPKLCAGPCGMSCTGAAHSATARSDWTVLTE